MGNSIKFLHTADLHLSPALSGMNRFMREKILGAQNEMLRKIRDYVCRESTDFILISGDVFDSVKVDAGSLVFFKHVLRESKDSPVFICCGNHDPVFEGSIYSAEDFPKNVHILGYEPSYFTLEIRGRRVLICGRSFSETLSPSPLWTDNENSIIENKLKAEGLGLDSFDLKILMIHGDMIRSGQNSSYNPVFFDDPCYKNFDYVALGHIHKAKELETDKTLFSYPGIPQGLAYDESGMKTLTEAEFTEKNEIKRKKLSFSSFHFLNLDFDIGELLAGEDICEKIHEKALRALKDSAGGYESEINIDPENIALRLVLKGAVINELPDAAIIEDKLRAKGYSDLRIYDNSFGAESKENGPAERGFWPILYGKYKQTYKKAKTDEERSFADKALRYTLRAYKDELGEGLPSLPELEGFL